MAKIVELSINITVSEMVKDDGSDRTLKIGQDTVDALEAVAQELIGENYIVEASIGGE